MFILRMFQDVLAKTGLVGVLILAGYIAIGFGAVLWLGLSIAAAAARSFRRWWHRRQLKKELRVLRGDNPSPLFTFYPELDDSGRPTPRPRMRALRKRGKDDDAAA